MGDIPYITTLCLSVALPCVGFILLWEVFLSEQTSPHEVNVCQSVETLELN